MKIKIKNKLIKKILSSIYKISYEFSDIEFSSFFIEVKDQTLYFLSRNNVVTIQRKIFASDDLEIIADGKVIVPAFVFNELVQKTNEDIVFEIFEPTLLSVKTKSYKTKINTIDLNFWKEPSLVVEGMKINFTKKDVHTLITQVAYTAQNKEGKIIFQGVNFRSIDGMLVATATNGSRIARKKFFLIDKKVDLILPLSALIEVNRICQSEIVNKITFTLGTNAALFEIDEGIKIHSKLINGIFSKTEEQFSQEFETTVLCDNKTLIAAIEKAGIFYEKHSVPIVVLRVDQGKLSVVSLEQSGVGFFEEGLGQAKVTGADQKVNLQVKFLLSTLRGFVQPNVIIKFSLDNGPVLFMMENDKTLKALICPVWPH